MGKASPSLRRKTINNVRFCNLSETDKTCIIEVFKRYEEMGGNKPTPCNFCYYNRPSCADGKTCSYCPAVQMEVHF